MVECVEDVVMWWLNSTKETQEEFLLLLCKLSNGACYPVSENTWYIHPDNPNNSAPNAENH